MAKPMTEPLTQAELAEARRSVAHAQEIWPDSWQHKNWVYGGEYARLLATVEAYREIVQAVANADPLTDVAREWAETPGWLNVALDVVWVTKARALLGME